MIRYQCEKLNLYTFCGMFCRDTVNLKTNKTKIEHSHFIICTVVLDPMCFGANIRFYLM